MALASLRQHLYRELEPAARADGLSATNYILTILIVAAATCAIIETEPLVAAGREHWFRILEVAFGIIFLVEYAARIWTAVDNPRFAGARSPRLRFAVTPAAIIDLIAVLPIFFAFGGGTTVILRFFRIIRILRLAKLGRTSRAWKVMAEAVYSRRYELVLTVAIAGLTVLVSGTMLYLAEADAQPDKFGSIPRALWWAIVTLTTVGYGDAYPVTLLGRFLGGIVALTGIGLIALPTGVLAASFSNALQKQREEKEAARSRRE